jgi:sporulation protein YlmC with PRC-barrel domain
MKTILAIASLAGLIVATQAAAQTQTDPNPPTRVTPQTDTRVMLKLDRGSVLVGKKVENRQGENLGKIEELAVDVQNGKIAYAVLSFGGFLGLGDKLFAIPWNALTLKPDQRPDDQIFIFDVSKERLKSAPGFDKNAWPDTANPQWGAEFDKYWEVESNRAARRTDTGARTDATGAQAGGTRTQPPGTGAMATGVKRIRKLNDELISRDVKDNAMNDLGDVEDISIDMNNGRIAYVIVQFDDTTRVPDEGGIKTSDALFAIPWQAVTIKPDSAVGTKDALVLNVPNEKLKMMPRFAENQWPNMNDMAWNNRVITFYGTRPFWHEEARITGRDIETDD